MANKKGAITLLTICVLLLSVFSITTRNYFTTAQVNDSELTGTILDKGVDTDGSGKYDYLEVDVQVYISIAGTYSIEAHSLENQSGTFLYLYAHNDTNLPQGTQWINITFYGPALYGAQFNPMNISVLELYYVQNGYQFLGEITNVPLSRIYNYTEFDQAAFLTGVVQSRGIDADSDGLFDYLQVGVEIDVLENGTYMVSINSFQGPGTYVPAYNQSTAFLTIGIQTMNVSIYGPEIFSSLHDSQGNISSINHITLFGSYESTFCQIDNEYGIPLSRSYAYREFESHAYFTGRLLDRGVDQNGDGLFDYLEVGVELNVTEAGNYTVSIDGLIGVRNSSPETVYYNRYLDANLSEHVHILNFTYPGPMIAYEHIDPTNVTGLRLAEQPNYYTLNYTSAVDLSRRYNHTEFNAPLKDMEVGFTIYPNATLDAEGNLNYTNMYPHSEGPKSNATLDFSTSGNVTTGSANGTMLLPEEALDEWPYNSILASFLAEYYNDMLSAQLNATLAMPPEASTACPFNSSAGDMAFSATYANGLVTVKLDGAGQLCPFFASQPPFNISDLTMLVDYLNSEIKGNITLHTISGFLLADAIVYINGNKTDIRLSGHVNVTYGSFFGTELNQTTIGNLIDEIDSYTGQGEGSLYNMSGGILEFVNLNTTRTFYDSTGELIDYNATLHGNFTDAVAMIVSQMAFGSSENQPKISASLNSVFSSVQNATLQLNYYHASQIAQFDLVLYSDVKQLWAKALQLVPPTFPVEEQPQVEAWLKIANATAFAVESASVKGSYSGDEQRLHLTATLTANIGQLKNNTILLIPDAVPSDMKESRESYLNTTYCKLNSLTISANYTCGTIEFQANFAIEGDFRAQVNHGKSLFIELFAIDGPGSADIISRLLNGTDIDINNFHMETTEGEDWMTMSFRNLKLYPQKDELGFIRFKLQHWFNMTNDFTEPPQEYEKLKIAIIAGFNGTHTVLFEAPGTVPVPSTTSLDYRVMIWQNTKLSSLKDLVFQIAYQEVKDYLGKNYYVPIFTNSTVSNFIFSPGTKSLSFTVNGTSGTGFCNVTIPRALLNASLSDWAVSIDGTSLNPADFSVNENAEFVFIYLNYSHSSHVIEISGTWIVTEFPPNLLPLVLVVLTLIALVIAVRQRKRLRAFGIRYQGAIRTFVNRILQLRT
jgi:hypothetical protein